MATYYQIKNWENYQHYKDRNPPWIKLHRELLTSETWITLADASRVLAVACMLTAAATGNRIPTNPAYIKRVAYLNSDPDFAPLLESQFIEEIDESGTALARASKTLAKRTKRLTRDRGETETETETWGTCGSAGRVHGFPPGFDEFWAAYPRHVAKQDAVKAFAKLRADDALLRRILDSLAAAKASPDWRKDDGRFIPHAATWLNGRRWEDELTPVETPAWEGAK